MFLKFQKLKQLLYKYIPLDRKNITFFIQLVRYWNGVEHSTDNVKQICLAFDVSALTSLSQVGRDFSSLISKTSIPFSIFNARPNFEKGPQVSQEEIKCYTQYCSEKIQSLLVLHFKTTTFPKPKSCVNVITPFWEFESGMTLARPLLFLNVSFAVVFSDFCYQYIKKIAPKHIKVFKIRYPYMPFISSDHNNESIRNKLGISRNDFVVFYNFDFRSGFNRKNPIAVIDAFEKAFSETNNATLILKISGYHNFEKEHRYLISYLNKLRLVSKIMIVDEHCSHNKMLEYIADSDVYISLHRGEGLGLGMLEAMSVGTPVICTNYGGNLDFCKPNTAFLVDYTMASCDDDFFLYRFVKYWAEPNVNQAAMYLRQIYENPSIGKEKALAAKAFIEDYYSIENFERDVREFIEVAQKTSKKQ